MSTFALVGPGLSRDGIQARAFAFAAESAYARMLRDALAPENIHVAQLIVPGPSGPTRSTAARTSWPSVCSTSIGSVTAVVTSPNPCRTDRDFASLLPLTLELKDFHETERISDLPRRLSTDGAPGNAEPKAGDLAFYAPWGNLAIYYRDAPRADGVVVLGRLADGGAEVLATAGRVTIER